MREIAFFRAAHPAEFPCNLNGRKYNRGAKSTDFQNSTGLVGSGIAGLAWRFAIRIRQLIGLPVTRTALARCSDHDARRSSIGDRFHVRADDGVDRHQALGNRAPSVVRIDHRQQPLEPLHHSCCGSITSRAICSIVMPRHRWNQKCCRSTRFLEPSSSSKNSLSPRRQS